MLCSASLYLTVSGKLAKLSVISIVSKLAFHQSNALNVKLQLWEMFSGINTTLSDFLIDTPVTF